MPALTVNAISKALSGYVRADEDFVAKLNMVMPRVYAMGNWRDLLFDWVIETDNYYFSLPEDADGVLCAMISDAPVEIQARWHDYRISGYADGSPSPIFGVVDDGYGPTKEVIVVEGAQDPYQISILPVTPNTSLPDEGRVIITAGRHTGGDVSRALTHVYTFELDGSASMTTATSDLVEVDSIVVEGVHENIDVVATQLSAAVTTLARAKGDGVVRYRRFRFANTNATSYQAKLLLKRAWVPVLGDSDIVYLGNLNAIKHGLLGMLAEDNADLERAQYHWTICRQLLEEELDSARAAAKPKVRLQPDGVFSSIPNMY